ncbi:MAG: isocitrate lyase/PEP mutase family protein [Geminicoccaceae bacterium]
MDQTEKARLFERLHVKGDPLVLYNIWDAGSAKAVAEAGANAIATGSWSVAGAQGYPDGEAIPLDMLETIVRRIVDVVDLPVTIDFEGGYGPEPDTVARHVARIMEAGAIGINFEDRIVGGDGLYDVDMQTARIAAIRQSADKRQLPFFINARTDLFLQAPAEKHGEILAAAKERALAYRDAGASGFFAPGLLDEPLITDLCEASPLPVNIMMTKTAPPLVRLAELGVARVSHGPSPFRSMMASLQEHAGRAFGDEQAITTRS